MDSARHVLDWEAPPCPKGGLADRKDDVVAEIREWWTSLAKVDRSASLAFLLIRWAEQHGHGDEPPPVILRALEDARHDPDMRDGFELAYRLLLARNAMLEADAPERYDPVPDLLIQGADLLTKRGQGWPPKPERREFLGMHVARASWVTGLNPTRSESKEPDKDTPTSDLPSAADLVARATQISYRYVVGAWATPIDGRRPEYLLERWERESSEPR